MLKKILAVTLTLFALGSAGAGQAGPAQIRANSSGTPTLVTAQWLAKHLGDRELRIVQVGHAPEEYAAAHIPGARFLSIMTVAPERGGLHAQMPAVAELRQIFQDAGISDGSRVVIYGEPLAAARLLVSLDYVGLGPHASLLDGGLSAWRAVGGPVTDVVPASARGTIAAHDRSAVVVDAAWIRAHLHQPGVHIVDARASRFYRGDNEPGPLSTRPGRVASASSVPYSSLLDASGRMLDTGSLRALFAGAGIRPGDRVVTYCHIGMQASLLYVAARALGHDASVYDGSYEEWSRAPELPIETGPARSR
jgi:thiosulfate/3-mercaptopyruvate sulfurtransferase